MQFTPEVVGVVGALAGTVIGSLGTLAVTLINKRAEEQKSLRDLALSAAVAEWKQHWDYVVSKNQSAEMYPLDTSIIYMASVLDVVLRGKINSANIESKLREIDDLIDRIMDYKRKTNRLTPIQDQNGKMETTRD